MIDLLDLHKTFILRHLGEGDIAVDFTMGNGHDTEFLSKTVGKDGHVYAFDIQPKALVSTAETLKNEGCPDNCTLICDSHSNVLKYVNGKICAGVFNLGYLPGGNNKQVTTLRPTTMEAVQELMRHPKVKLILATGGGAMVKSAYSSGKLCKL